MSEFIKGLVPHAQKVQKNYSILASIVISQAIHESNWGKSGLATNGKNLFGIKGSYNGQFVTMRTHEYSNGKKIWIDAKFRKYPSWYESMEDLAKLYINGVSWDRNKYKKILGEKDYKKAANAIQSAGYATDPNYASKIIKTIESNNLTQYDAVTVLAPTKSTRDLIRKGDTGEKVKVIQKAVGTTGDGIFGEQTEKAVREFQSKNGLAVDGIVGPLTWAKITAPKSIVLYPGLIKKGAKGENVKSIQRVAGVTADGIFGPNTEVAVKVYQKKNGLVADGIVGPKTWNKMFN